VSWTRQVADAEAADPLTSIYEHIRSRSSRGSVSNLWQAQGLDPNGLEGCYALYEKLMGDPAPLTPTQAELLAVVVSATNGCTYCVAHHGPRLARVLGNEGLARSVAMDYRIADLTARDRVLLDYAVALTCEPSERKREDIERVREYGFGDAMVVRATEIVAYYNMVNRVASSLGVELEEGVKAWEYGSQK
jgi:uncharacterized peroxidase-related enzyme